MSLKDSLFKLVAILAFMTLQMADLEKTAIGTLKVGCREKESLLNSMNNILDQVSPLMLLI